MNVLIAGGSGLLGKQITNVLIEQGHNVGWLTRTVTFDNKKVTQYHWNPSENKIDQSAVNQADAIINLTGESIGETSWTKSGKQQILQSRIDSVRVLADAINKRSIPLLSFVGVSGAGYYGNSSSPKKETDAAGSDFPAMVAFQWESEYRKIQISKPAHFCILRLAVVLSMKGGALPKIVQPIQWGIGSSLGTGKQPFNWIHLDDAALIFAEALKWNGEFNISAPDLVNNRELTELIAHQVKKPLFLPPVPAFFLRLALGERASLVLDGNISDTSKLAKTGYQFRFRTIKSAVENLIPPGDKV
jgi:uncharacterized protein (TIGR01777 family)